MPERHPGRRAQKIGRSSTMDSTLERRILNRSRQMPRCDPPQEGRLRRGSDLALDLRAVRSRGCWHFPARRGTWSTTRGSVHCLRSHCRQEEVRPIRSHCRVDSGSRRGRIVSRNQSISLFDGAKGLQVERPTEVEWERRREEGENFIQLTSRYLDR